MSVALCCSVLRCVAVCCSALQCVLPCAARYARGKDSCVAVCCSVLQCVAVCCSVLQCTAVHYSVLQCVAVCCGVWQCVAECCSVLQCAAMRYVRGKDLFIWDGGESIHYQQCWEFNSVTHCNALQHTATVIRMRCNSHSYETVKLSNQRKLYLN